MRSLPHVFEAHHPDLFLHRPAAPAAAAPAAAASPKL